MVGSVESFWSSSALCARSGESFQAGAELAAVKDGADRIATFHFGSLLERSASPSVSSVQQSIFKADFYRELASIKKWSDEAGWRRDIPPILQIFVSDDYKISKSLVPAWSGRAGHMQFPAWRVIARKAAIAHELAHV